jgi:hypothetical protein
VPLGGKRWAVFYFDIKITDEEEHPVPAYTGFLGKDFRRFPYDGPIRQAP